MRVVLLAGVLHMAGFGSWSMLAADRGIPSFALGPYLHEWGYIWIKSGWIGVYWNPDTDRPIYGWQNPEQLFAYPYCGNKGDLAGSRVTQWHNLPTYRLAAEGSLLTGYRGEKAKNLGRGNFTTWPRKSRRQLESNGYVA